MAKPWTPIYQSTDAFWESVRWMEAMFSSLRALREARRLPWRFLADHVIWEARTPLCVLTISMTEDGRFFADCYCANRTQATFATLDEAKAWLEDSNADAARETSQI